MVVTQLLERSLLAPEIRGSNPNSGKVLSTNCKLNRKDENIEKEAGNGPFFMRELNLSSAGHPRSSKVQIYQEFQLLVHFKGLTFLKKSKDILTLFKFKFRTTLCYFVIISALGCHNSIFQSLIADLQTKRPI